MDPGSPAERDRRVLAFAAEHRFIVAAQIAALLGATVRVGAKQIEDLSSGGRMRAVTGVSGEVAGHQITRAGLAALGSPLPAPRPPDLSAYHHDLGLGWLMLLAERGRFGPVREVVSERRMRSDDGRRPDGALSHGVRLGGVGPGGRPRLHHPDMLLVTQAGHRVAFELELTGKATRRREGILAAYAADRRIDLVVYLVADVRTGRAIERSAARLGMSDLVRVGRVTVGAPGPRPGGGPVIARRASRPPTAMAEAGR